LMSCFNRLIQDILGINIPFNVKKPQSAPQRPQRPSSPPPPPGPSSQYRRPFVPPRSSSPPPPPGPSSQYRRPFVPPSSSIEPQAIKRKEKEYDRKGVILPDELFGMTDISAIDMNRNILWGPRYKNRIDVWRQKLQKKLQTSSGTTLKVYSFIEKNIENSLAILYKLRVDIIGILGASGVNIDELLLSCNGVKTCEDEVIITNIKMLIDKIMKKKYRTSQENYEKMNMYLRLSDFVREFLADMRRIYDDFKSNRQQRLQKIESDRASMIERRGKAILRTIEPSIEDKLRTLLKRTLKYKFDDKCEDDECKKKELVTTIKRVLSTQEQMLLTQEEVKMLREYYNKHSGLAVEDTPKKLPRLILKLRRPPSPPPPSPSSESGNESNGSYFDSSEDSD
jgi:hypothetical protein